MNRVFLLLLFCTVLLVQCPLAIVNTCDCKGPDCSCRASCSAPLYAFCNCNPPNCNCGCYTVPPIVPPTNPKTASYYWTWYEVAQGLAKPAANSGATLKEILENNGIKPSLVTSNSSYSKSTALNVPPQISTMELLRQISTSTNTDVLLSGIPIMAKPSGAPTVNLTVPVATPPVLYVMLWSFYDLKIDFLLDESIQNYNFSIELNNVQRDDVEGIVYEKIYR